MAELSERRVLRPAAGAGIYGGWIARSLRYLVMVPIFLLLGFLVIYPIGVLIYGSITTGSPRAFSLSLETLTLRNYTELIQSRQMWEATQNTLISVFVASLLALAIALFFAWLVARTDVPYRGVIEAAAIMPLYVSPLVAALAWSTLGGPRQGLINVFLRDLGIPITVNLVSMTGVIIIMAIYYAPYAYMFLVGSLRMMDPSLEEAAAICGASTWQTVRRVTLPLISYAILSALLLVGVELMALYAIPAILGEPGGVVYLTTYLYKLTLGSPPRFDAAAAVSVFLMMLTFVGVFTQRRVLAGRRLTTVTGKGFRPRQMKLGNWRWVCLALSVIYIFIAVVLPYCALIQASLRKFMFIPSTLDLFSLQALVWDNFYFILFQNARTIKSMWNSIQLGITTALIGATLCFFLGYIINRSKLPGRRYVDYISTIPIAVPGIVIGVAYLWAWITLPVGIYGTLWILGAAYIARFLPDGVRAASSSLVQIHEELEESARVHGASFWQTLRRVVVPLARPGVTSSMILLFILSVRELGSSIFLVTSDTIVMSVETVFLWEGGRWGYTAALAIVQSVLLFIGVAIFRKVLRGEIKAE